MVSSASNSGLTAVPHGGCASSSSPKATCLAETMVTSSSSISSTAEILDLMKEQNQLSTQTLDVINQKYRDQIQTIQEDFNAQIKAMEEKAVAEKLVALEQHPSVVRRCYPASSVKEEPKASSGHGPPMYSGSRHENPIDWVDAIERYYASVRKNLSEAQEPAFIRQTILPHCVSGSAANIVQSKLYEYARRGQVFTWRHLKDELQRAIHPTSSEGDAVKHIFSLLRTGQGREESGSGFFNKMISMYHELSPSLCVNELFLVSLIISRLNPFYAENLYLRAEEYHLDRLESILVSIDRQQYIARSSYGPKGNNAGNNPNHHVTKPATIRLPTISMDNTSNGTTPARQHPHTTLRNNGSSPVPAFGPSSSKRMMTELSRLNSNHHHSSGSTTHFPTKTLRVSSTSDSQVLSPVPGGGVIARLASAAGIIANNKSNGRCRSCRVEGCTRVDRGGGLCGAHGGGRRCAAPGCEKASRKKGYCSRHFKAKFEPYK